MASFRHCVTRCDSRALVTLVIAVLALSNGCALLPGETGSAAPPSTAPTPVAAPTTTTTEPELLKPYTVEKGDTLIRIADRHGIHLNDLVRVNNIADPTMIFVGQLLLIPPPPGPETGPQLTIAPATDPILPPLLPTTSAPRVTVGGSS